MEIKTPAEFKQEKDLKDQNEQQQRQREYTVWLKQKYAIVPNYLKEDVKNACRMVALEGHKIVRVGIREQLKREHEHLGGWNKNHFENSELAETFTGTWDEFLGIDEISKTLYSKGYMLYRADNREHYASLHANRVYFLTLANDLPKIHEVTYQEVESSLAAVCTNPSVISTMLAAYADQIKENHDSIEQARLAREKKDKCYIM